MTFFAGRRRAPASVAGKCAAAGCGGGYTLVELLVALLVFSLGALAVAAMQFGAVQATRSASESAAALMLAEDLAQRLLSDTGAIDRYAQALDGSNAMTGGDVTACLDGATCDPPAWAERGIAAWLALSEQRALALPRACVSRDATTLRVGVSWVSRAVLAPPSSNFCTSGDASEGRRALTLTAPLGSAP
ncbi:type IV pilus modification protein PilV [Chromatocurvus halotolerans]|uniref:Type IV pilus modification protein PilV n=1 Tax=Chromatocurvus halotolerans TaxID=1132028 RepID=A0A4R2KQ88_9GAMM|nr:type IV pilus modification protein PilV [Chromatocurvus halotolerans]TCO74862.1 type IV pilus modification protein PilV [Chromatocurvus halotolerans]